MSALVLVLVLEMVVVMVSMAVGLLALWWSVAAVLDLLTLLLDRLPAVDGWSKADGAAVHLRLVALDHWDHDGKVVLLLQDLVCARHYFLWVGLWTYEIQGEEEPKAINTSLRKRERERKRVSE